MKAPECPLVADIAERSFHQRGPVDRAPKYA
jgi:hypothetical protein